MRVELLGSALFSLVEPQRGHEVAFHRWYERDHFYAGVMAGPFAFSGRRWVATRGLKALRAPQKSPIADDIALGSYLHTYWILKGRHEAFVAWAIDAYNELKAGGRMFAEAAQVFTAFLEYRFPVSRDPDGVPADLALEHPYPGLGVVMLEPSDPAEDVEALAGWLRREHLPRVLSGSEAGLCLCFRAYPVPESVAANVPPTPGIDRRVQLLYFLERNPFESWPPLLGRSTEDLARSGRASLVYAAPFLPTIPGSDRHADELW